MDRIMSFLYVLYKNPGKTIWILVTSILIWISLTIEPKTTFTTEIVGEAYINKELYGYIKGGEENGFTIISKEGTTLNGNTITYEDLGVIFLLSSIFGWLSLVFLVIFWGVSIGEDVWDYDDNRTEYLVKTVKSYYEGGEYIYIFRGRLIQKSNRSESKSNLERYVSKYFEFKESFPIYTPIEVKREKKLKEILG